jgi:hypothetical protein
MVVTAYHSSHKPYSLTRALSNWENFDFQKLDGMFLNSETNTEFVIQHKNDKNYKFLIDGQENNGVLVTPTKLLVNNYVHEFPKAERPISAFNLSADRIKNVKFERVIQAN